MNMQDAVGTLLRRQAERRNGMRPGANAHLEVLEQFVAHILPDILLCLFRRTTNMWGRITFGQTLQRRLERIAVLFRLPGYTSMAAPDSRPSFNELLNASKSTTSPRA